MNMNACCDACDGMVPEEPQDDLCRCLQDEPNTITLSSQLLSEWQREFLEHMGSKEILMLKMSPSIANRQYAEIVDAKLKGFVFGKLIEFVSKCSRKHLRNMIHDCYRGSMR